MMLSMELSMVVTKEEIHQMMSLEVMEQLIVQQMLMEDLDSDALHVIEVLHIQKNMLKTNVKLATKRTKSFSESARSL
jgi:hypothetical protein